MNKRIVFYTVGRILQCEGILMLLPTAVSIIYGEKEWIWLFLSALLAFLAGSLPRFVFKKCNRTVFAREGFAIVALSWVLMSAIGALPFYLSGELPDYISAFFETVSGFTTTGASVIPDVEALSHGNLFWRSFTHWVGGMGILVFIMAVFPSESGRDIHIMRAEVPGPISGKIVPRIRNTAKLLYVIYFVLTAVEVIFLLLGEMDLYESLIYSFGTAGTGGFGIKSASVGCYSAYSQWVITIFMLIFAANFNIYYFVLIGRVKSAFKSGELWCYLAIVGVSITAITVNVFSMYSSLSDAIRHSSFQVASIISTTGFSTVDFNQWPELSKTILVVLMFIGGCAGSTAGGLKVSRIILMFKTVKRDLRRLVHPRSVNTVRFEGKTVDSETLNGVGGYIIVYMIIFFVVLLLLSFSGLDFLTNFTATAACFNNVGPGFGAVGPLSNFSCYSGVYQIILSFAMLLGRLEIFPILLAFAPSTWRKNK